MTQPFVADTAARLQEALPEPLRPFVRVESAPMSQALLDQVADCFAEAGRLLYGVIRPNRVCKVVFAVSPFQLNVGLGNLTFTPLPDTVHATIESMVFIDVPRLVSYRPNFRVASLLEELVHAMMGVKDEGFVKLVVAAMYPGIATKDGNYVEPA